MFQLLATCLGVALFAAVFSFGVVANSFMVLATVVMILALAIAGLCGLSLSGRFSKTYFSRANFWGHGLHRRTTEIPFQSSLKHAKDYRTHRTRSSN